MSYWLAAAVLVVALLPQADCARLLLFFLPNEGVRELGEKGGRIPSSSEGCAAWYAQRRVDLEEEPASKHRVAQSPSSNPARTWRQGRATQVSGARRIGCCHWRCCCHLAQPPQQQRNNADDVAEVFGEAAGHFDLYPRRDEEQARKKAKRSQRVGSPARL